jgi:hypothetical protein
MEINVSCLDDTIKDTVRSDIKKMVLKKFRTLPISGQDEMVEDTLTDDVIRKLEEIIIDYYKEVAEHDINCVIEKKDYVNIYFRRV